MIPVERQPAVAQAVRTTFGSGYDELRPLSGGLSTALVFRIVVGGRPYLMRLISHTQALGDPTREFACMSAAADAGIAPRIHYANAEDRILITDFVDARPFPDDFVPFLVPVLQTLHALPGFQKPRMGNYLDTADGFIRRFQAARILSENIAGDLFGRYEDVRRVYPRDDAQLVACHNDLKPENIRFDGTRVWLVDWEAAFLNDRYADLAVAANFFVRDEAHEESYLRRYFGDALDDDRRARFHLMRQIIHLFYGAMFMRLAAASGTPVDPDLGAPPFREFHRRLLAAELSVVSGEVKVQYAKVHLAQALQNMRTRRFHEALARVEGASSHRR
jgi:aminoglycoside phosphotransferase (APT) family kinase protein